jgi:beta-glucosidase
MPAPVVTGTTAHKPPPAASSVAPRTPPNQPETRTATWEKRALGNTAAAAAQAASIDVVFDGDSITDLWQKAGAQVWATAFASYHPFDFGISGDTTQNLLWRLAHGQAQGLHPKVILLMIGTNDMKYTSSPQEIADGVAAVIQQYRKICPDAVIILQSIFPRAKLPTDPYRLKVNATNPLLAKLGDGSKVIYLDFGDKFLAPDGTISKEIMPDYLHPSEKGYQIWADAISPVLAKYAGNQAGP